MFDRLLCSGSTTFGSLAPVMLLLSPLAVILSFGPRPAEAQSPNTFVRQGVPISQQGILTENGEGSGSGAPDLQAKIKSAVSAGPSSLSANATVAAPDGTVLREGTNSWTCFPDNPDREGQNPMCLDREWVDWLDAYVNQETPDVTQIGVGYMLQGGSFESNVDPYAESPTPDNQWMQTVPPHLMIIVPDLQMYEGLPTDPDNGGPWLMWPDTPYAHIMVPTTGKGE